MVINLKIDQYNKYFILRILCFFVLIFFYYCSSEKSKSTHSFKIQISNIGNEELHYSYAFYNEYAFKCSTTPFRHPISAGEVKDLTHVVECEHPPDYKRIVIFSGGIGGSNISYTFLDEIFHVECDTRKCTNTLGDFVDTDEGDRLF